MEKLLEEEPGEAENVVNLQAWKKKQFKEGRQARRPCLECGGTLERLRLDEWVCANCNPNPFFKGGA